MANASAAEVLFSYQQMVMATLSEGMLARSLIVTLLSMFFISLNAIMVYTLRSKAVFKETPRYILFTHMLVNDSIQLLFTYILFICSVLVIRVMSVACAFLIFVSTTTFINAPLNLAVMSLERYVAICFPLRHVQIATQKRTQTAIGVIWFVSSINILFDLFYGATNPTFFTSDTVCTREKFFLKPWQVDVLQGFNIFFFLSVTMIIIFSYVSIMIAARSFSSNKEPATKAHKTVLLHLIQLGLCSTSFLYIVIEQAAALTGNSTFYREMRYLNYLFVLILPRCLSPLIYGLRDEALRPLFMYFLCFGRRKRASVINIH
ncbi:odorant receptor 131-2-like [Trichomycterus rosablanca]|uniref:odorant receptor 131-2-like n=1 Tax=Trichomycterus rosablanca TaxID=2290929 RepID=UPI002F35A751